MRLREFVLLLVVSLIIAGCTKEGRIRRSLNGSWNITEVITETTIDDQLTIKRENPSATVSFDKQAERGASTSWGLLANPFPSQFHYKTSHQQLDLVDLATGEWYYYAYQSWSKESITLYRRVVDGTATPVEVHEIWYTIEKR